MTDDPKLAAAIAEAEAIPGVKEWVRALIIAPDLDRLLALLNRGRARPSFEIEGTVGLLLTMLHPADRRDALKTRASALDTAAVIIAEHGDNASEQLHYLSRAEIPDEDERLDAVEHYIAVSFDEAGNEIERDIEPILECAECKDSWQTAPQRRRSRAASASCEARPIKCARRTKADIEAVKNAIYGIVETDRPMTLRQTFYRLVAAGIVPKEEAEYKFAGRMLLQMRREGEIPYDWIADNTRWMRKPRSFESIEEALQDTAATYRRAVWRDLPVYVEVWCEKDALVGVLLDETAPYDVPLMVARGFSSESYLYGAGEQIRAAKRPAFIFHFGDRDPSGVVAGRDIETRLRGFAPECEIHFERIAVTEQQIIDMKLPTRPTKREGNTHARGFVGDSVDLDAIAPADLRRLARECIERHIPAGYMDTLAVAEKSEREIFTAMAMAQSRLE